MGTPFNKEQFITQMRALNDLVWRDPQREGVTLKEILAEHYSDGSWFHDTGYHLRPVEEVLKNEGLYKELGQEAARKENWVVYWSPSLRQWERFRLTRKETKQMTAEQIIDHIRANPGHPPTISTAEWASVIEFITYKDRAIGVLSIANQERQAEIQRLQSQIAQLLDEKKQTHGR